MPRRPHRRVRISKGIYRERASIRVKVQVGSGPDAWTIEQAFPHDTPLKELKAWRESKRLEMLKDQPTVSRRSLEADATRYLSTQTHKASYPAKASELRAWCDALGELRRHQVRGPHIAAVIAQWLAANVSKKTIVNRCRTLHHLYVTLADDKHARTPLDNVEIPAPEKRRPVDIPDSLIARTEKRLRAAVDHARTAPLTDKQRAQELRDAARAHARFMVQAAAGIRPSQLMRLPREGAIDLRRRLVAIDAGKGGLPIVQAMNAEQFAAWRAFIEADAFGSYDPSRYRRRLRAAGWPDGLRPYNTKHAVGIRLAESGVDTHDIADWFGHTDPKTTKIYTGTPIKRLRRLAAVLDDRFGWATTAPRATPRAAPRPAVGRSQRLAETGGKSRKKKTA